MNITEKKREIAKLHEQISTHKVAICKLREDLGPLEQEIATHVAGIAIGDVIEFGKRPVYRGKVMKSIDQGGGRYKYIVQRVLKSGMPGAVRTVYSFDNPRKVTP